MELEVKNLHKSFQGKEVLHGVSFSVSSGKALGLLGRNGAGKSTTIRILMDVFKANSGEILMNGKPFAASQHNIGYLPEERGLYPKKKVSEQLIYLAQLRGLGYSQAKQSLRYWLDRLGIAEYENRLLETLSKGNQQKVQLAQTLMCDPDIVILDEPFSGLDPVNSSILQEVVQECIQQGKLVIFSSHQMSYVEEFCEDIVILHHGDVVLQGNLKQIKKEYGYNRIVLAAGTLTPAQFEEKLVNSYSDLLSIYEKRSDCFIAELKEGVQKNDVLSRLLQDQIELDQFRIYEASLTDIFVSKAGDEE
ncbi:MAG: ABC transporter ATP-binding protein [Erysipelotrichaceae bacterium]|nr:ABC transporter ATP-binding protein [Erysipelotrichaceae bacterium]